MRVSGFMIPKDQVKTCVASDTIETVLDAILDNKISAVVCLEESKPVGTKVSDIMVADVKAVFENQPRDKAARVFETNKIHHAVVVGENGEFSGLISSLDIANECVKDDRAWPWNRAEPVVQ
jgi:CBS domain-containing protein